MWISTAPVLGAGTTDGCRAETPIVHGRCSSLLNFHHRVDRLDNQMSVERGGVPAMATAVTATVLGVLALVSVAWFPTLAIALGLVAVIVGFLGPRTTRRDSSTGESSAADRLAVLGMVLGAASLAATVIVIVATTD
jgi:hypothetical protein